MSDTMDKIRALCFQSGFTTWDQDRQLGPPPWRDEAALIAWEETHGHDARVKCYPEFGCQLLIDPRDILQILTEGND